VQLHGLQFFDSRLIQHGGFLNGRYWRNSLRG
jgi:hypothetical protein